MKGAVLGILLGGIVTAGSGSALATLLVEVDFSGTAPGGVGSIASSDAQFTAIDSAVTFDDAANALTAIGGGAGTSGWVYDGTGTAAANTDLHVASTFGAPTRFDLDLGFAASGMAYTITNVQVDVRASNSAGTTWDFMYRKPDTTTVTLGGVVIAVQSGANPITTYSIDVTGENLTATDAATAWNTTGTGELRFAFYEANGTGNDNLQIDALRVNGTVIPEPGTFALAAFGGMGIALLRRFRRRG